MNTITMPVSPDLVHEELESIIKIVSKWRDAVNTGVPGVDIPGADAEEALDNFLRELVGELLLAAGKTHNLALVLAER
jgi:hypothetical protein